MLWPPSMRVSLVARAGEQGALGGAVQHLQAEDAFVPLQRLAEILCAYRGVVDPIDGRSSSLRIFKST